MEKQVTSPRRFTLLKGPHIRRADFNKLNTKTMMLDVIIALIPLFIFAWYKNGISPFINDKTNVWGMLYPFIFMVLGAGSAYLFESLYYLFFYRNEKEKINHFKKSLDNYSIIPGLMLAMILPLYTPIWVLLLGTLFAIWIGKMLFGGFGYNLFNPALVGYVFVITAFYGVIKNNGGYLNPSEVDVLTGATPLAEFKEVLAGTKNLNDVINAQGGLFNFFIGMRAGSLAETSGILCILAYIYLVIKKVIDWKMPLIYVITIFVITYIIGAFNGYYNTLNFALFNVLSGGVLYGAVFMVTEPVTSPRNVNAKIFYCLFIAILTILLRFLSNLDEGVCTAILFMNMFTPMFDLSFAKLQVEDKIKNKIIGYGAYILVFVLITLYIILRLVVK